MAFGRCADETSPVERIEEDWTRGQELSVKGVPTFILGGKLFGSPPDSTGWLAIVEGLLAENEGVDAL